MNNTDLGKVALAIAKLRHDMIDMVEGTKYYKMQEDINLFNSIITEHLNDR